MRAELVMIGTELLLGDIIDTNAVFLAQSLRDIGVDLFYKTTVGDNLERIATVLDHALDRSDVVITSGGLGPTVDDVTREAVARATGRRLVYSLEFEAQIAERFRSFGRLMAENNKRQATIPEGALPLTNPVGTAPCFIAEDRAGRGCIVSLPGVPRELKYMMDHEVAPWLRQRMGDSKIIRTRILRTCAVGESNIDQAIGDLMTSVNPTVGLAAHPGQTDVRITAKACSTVAAEELIAPMESELRKRLGVAVYGVGEETVPQVVAGLLKIHGAPVGIVDGLTGGFIGEELRKAGGNEIIASCVDDASQDKLTDMLKLDVKRPWTVEDVSRATEALAFEVAPANGFGLVLFSLSISNDPLRLRCFITVKTPDGTCRTDSRRVCEPGNDHVPIWLMILGMDWIRRFLLAVPTSPVD